MVERRYQVFVSSTFHDLQDERREIMQALLELDCIPAGMELFPAANEDQWTLIKRVIDDCDYYIVVVGGRYGSCDANGMSFTEKEYRYALETKKPTIGFIHANPESIAVGNSESDPVKREKLQKFSDLIKEKHVKMWSNPSDLGSKVSRAIVNLRKTYPSVGWVKSTEITSDESMREILRLKNIIEELESEKLLINTKRPEGTEGLAQGDDIFSFSTIVTYRSSENDWFDKKMYYTIKMTWNDIFKSISLFLIDEASETEIYEGFSKYLYSKHGLSVWNYVSEFCKERNLTIKSMSKISCDEIVFKNIIVQLRALGLVTQGRKKRGIADKATYLSLTGYGEFVMTRLNAFLRPSSSEDV